MRDEELRAQGPPKDFDNTMISNFVSCPRALYWFMRRVISDYIPPYFTFGRAFGQGINTWHETQSGNLPIEARIAAAQKTAEDIWMKEQPMEKGNDNFANLTSMIDTYCWVYGKDEAWETIATEIGFQVPIPGTTVNYSGALDSYINWPGYGLLLREDKTTGNYITDAFINQWTHSSQVTGYIWALWQTLGEEPFGALMNFASKRPRKDATLRFSRDLQKRDEFRTQRFMEDTVELIDNIRRQWDTWKWPQWGERNPMNCVGGPGKSPCAYRPLCLLPTDPWELDKDLNLVGMGFSERPPWTPWAREGDDD